MINRILSPAKALRTLRKTALLLDGLLAPVSQAQAAALRDGADGWSVLSIACHLRDYERIIAGRLDDILARERPALADMDNDALAAVNRYADQELGTVLAELRAGRQALLDRLAGLADEQWGREGVHPSQGPGTVLDIAINAGLHDVDHLEQLARCLAGA
ncbi:MAG TPA: DinB family protein [Herpetosiphonaceae bacterium]